MGDGIDIQFIRENYQRMTDNAIIRIATQDASGLMPEALKIIKEEIEKRKLDTNIIKGIEAQNRSYTNGEIEEYCALIRNLICPDCGTGTSVLNGTITSEVMSFLLFTENRQQSKIACPNCLDKANNKALIKTILMGWWAIPWGVIRTIQAIGQNIKAKKTNHLEAPNEFLRSFVLSKIGLFETYRNDHSKLQEIISE